ncbi:MAG: flagellar protein FlaG [Desulfovibrionaceae bacterium]|nr:flagellar protein FlaG [Desulfovibrionaceae bacterium]
MDMQASDLNLQAMLLGEQGRGAQLAIKQVPVGTVPVQPVQKTQTSGNKQSEHKELSKESAQNQARDIEEHLNANGVKLKFNVIEESGDIQVEVRDSEQNKVIRKIPPDDLLKLAATMRAMAGGFVDRSS